MSCFGDFVEFVYGDINDDAVKGSVMCTVKSLGLSMAICGGSVAGSYAIVIAAFLICGVTIVPMVLLVLLWDGFMDDVGYTFKWLWLAALMIGVCVSGLLFLPVWVCLTLLIAAVALTITLSLTFLALSIPCAIIIGVVYLIYLACPYCCECISECCKSIRKTSVAPSTRNTSSTRRTSSPRSTSPPSPRYVWEPPPTTVKPPPKSSEPTLPPLNENTIIFESTNSLVLPPINGNTIIFESTYNK